MAIEVTIHSTGSGACSYSGKECEGITVTFADGTFTECFMSTQTFLRFLKMKLGAPPKTSPRPTNRIATNGAAPTEAPK